MNHTRSSRALMIQRSEIALARVDAFGPLRLMTSGNPYTMDQKAQDAAARNPRWVPAISSGTGASTSAHVGTLPAGEAARVIFRFGLWPAALELWGIAPNDPRAKQWENARWKDGQLTLPGLAPLPLPAIAVLSELPPVPEVPVEPVPGPEELLESLFDVATDSAAATATVLFWFTAETVRLSAVMSAMLPI